MGSYYVLGGTVVSCNWYSPSMNRLEGSPLHGSVVALALTALALLISLFLRRYLEPDIFLLFVVAVWLSAWYYGRTFGLLATGASAIALLYFFIYGATPPWAR